jgi:hypothetical protein
VQLQQLWLLLQGEHVLLRLCQRLQMLAALQMVSLGTEQQPMQQQVRKQAGQHQQQAAQQLHRLGSARQQQPIQEVRKPCGRHQQQHRLQHA